MNEVFWTYPIFMPDPFLEDQCTSLLHTPSVQENSSWPLSKKVHYDPEHVNHFLSPEVYHVSREENDLSLISSFGAYHEQ
jgi:hypothetical protein